MRHVEASTKVLRHTWSYKEQQEAGGSLQVERSD